MKNKAQIRQILLKYPVEFAYLFGSYTTGNTGPLSDVDFAVYFREKLSESMMFNMKLKISHDLSILFKKLAPHGRKSK